MTEASKRPQLVAYGSAAGLTGLITAAAWPLRGLFAAPDVVMLYLAMISSTAVLFGRGPSLLAAALSVAAYDFLFVPPIFTFAVGHDRHFLTFAAMFAVSLLFSDLMRRMRRQEEAAQAAALRARTEEMRSSLLSAVSHDLRTPLAAIMGAATALRDRAERVPSAAREDLLETICEEAERLDRLVGNLLDMTRVDAGGMKLAREWIPLEELVGTALGRLEEKLGERSIRVELQAGLPLVSVDPVLFGQVFVNLFENVVKYTPAGSPIEVAAIRKDDAVEIEVRDRGPGLPPGADRLFEKFVRGHHRGVSGVGLGLAICRGLVEAHGGTIVAENRPDGGACFRIALPIVGSAPSVPAELPHDAAVPEAQT